MEETYKISVVLPNRNESEIDNLVHKLKSVLKRDERVSDFEIIVSHDKLGEGYGKTLKKGIRRSRYPYILIMDSDNTYNPSDVPKMLDELPFRNIVVAERRDSFRSCGIIKTIGRLLVQRIAEFRTGYELHDYNSGFRIFKRSFFDSIEDFLPDKFSFTTTMTILALNEGLKIGYVPVLYGFRAGKSSLNWKDFFKMLKTVETWRPRKRLKTT